MFSAPLVAVTAPLGCDYNWVHIAGVSATCSDRRWVIPRKFAFLIVLSLGPTIGLRMRLISAML